VTRNVLRGPGTAEFDFSALKNFAITERFTAQFRAEAFNIINHPNFGNPSANISTGNVGTITATSFDNRPSIRVEADLVINARVHHERPTECGLCLCCV